MGNGDWLMMIEKDSVIHRCWFAMSRYIKGLATFHGNRELFVSILKYLFNQARISFKNGVIILSIRMKPDHCISHTPQRTPVVDHESDWSLVFEQQADLSMTHGDVSNLVTAVRHGADLRLYRTTEWYEETIYFQHHHVSWHK